MRFALIFAVGLTLSTTARPVRAEPDFTAAHHPGRVFVRFQPGTPAGAKQAAHAGASTVRVLRDYRYLSGLQVVEVADGRVRAAITEYAKNPHVLYAHPDYALQLMGVPDDTQFPYLWALHNTGQNEGEFGTPDSDIDAVQAWDIWESDLNVDTDFRIAVIDTGVDYNHEDFYFDENENGSRDPDEPFNIWINPCEDHEPLGVIGPEDFDGNDDELASCPAIDVVFLVDTSLSTGDDLDELCNEIDGPNGIIPTLIQ